MGFLLTVDNRVLSAVSVALKCITLKPIRKEGLMPSQLELDTALLVNAVQTNLGSHTTWPRLVGYPGDIEAALVDAVFSTRYLYTTPRGNGLQPKIDAWIRQRNRPHGPTTHALINEISAAGGADHWATTHLTKHRVAGRPKGAVVLEAAELLSWRGYASASDVTTCNLLMFLDLLQAVEGVGLPTARYVAMLLGFPEVKPDIWVKGYLKKALGRPVRDAYAIAAVKCVAQELRVPVSALEHAMWSYERTPA